MARGITKEHGNLLGVMDSFIILTVGRASSVYTYVKAHELMHFKFVKYASIKGGGRGRREEGRKEKEEEKREKKKGRKKEEKIQNKNF